MTRPQKILSIVAAALIVVTLFTWETLPPVCLASAVCALAISLYLRRRGAFLNDNAPLAGAFLIAGSAMMTFAGIIVVSPRIGVIVYLAIMIPIGLFLLAFGWRERLRSFIRNIDAEFQDDKKPPP